jgi:hypothetical protein
VVKKGRTLSQASTCDQNGMGIFLHHFIVMEKADGAKTCLKRDGLTLTVRYVKAYRYSDKIITLYLHEALVKSTPASCYLVIAPVHSIFT